MTKICVIGNGISSALEGNHGGGAEKQQALIVKGLKSRGLDVIVLEYHLSKEKKIDGINFYPAWEISKTSFIDKFKGILKQLINHEIDVIYARTTQLYVPLLFIYIKYKKLKIKLFWGIGGDEDLTSKLNYIRVKRATSLYAKFNKGIMFNINSRLSFIFSDTVICQTQEQLKRCSQISIKKPTALISNIYNRNNLINNILINFEYDAIWVGKFTGNKGEDILLKISQDLSELKILCLGHVSENFKQTTVFKEIKNQKNLFLKGRVPAQQVHSYIAQADFVLNTSPAEGLSNVFLEGWDLTKPVISYIVNPNEYLTKGEAGYCAKNSYSNLIKKIKTIMKDKEFMKYHGKKGKEILIKNHNTELILSKYEKLFSN